MNQFFKSWRVKSKSIQSLGRCSISLRTVLEDQRFGYHTDPEHEAQHVVREEDRVRQQVAPWVVVRDQVQGWTRVQEGHNIGIGMKRKVMLHSRKNLDKVLGRGTNKQTAFCGHYEVAMLTVVFHPQNMGLIGASYHDTTATTMHH